MKAKRLKSLLEPRKSIGWAVLALPVLLVVASVLFSECSQLQASLSEYYHTRIRFAFVGMLVLLALLLFRYRGYDRTDTWVQRASAVCVLLMALFPIDFSETPVAPCHWVGSPRLPGSHAIHLAAGACFFLMMIYLVLFRFTRSDKRKDQLRKPKINRNRSYRLSGWVMAGCLVLIGCWYFGWNAAYPETLKYAPVFWLESTALWALGFAWLTKAKVFSR